MKIWIIQKFFIITFCKSCKNIFFSFADNICVTNRKENLSCQKIILTKATTVTTATVQTRVTARTDLRTNLRTKTRTNLRTAARTLLTVSYQKKKAGETSKEIFFGRLFMFLHILNYKRKVFENGIYKYNFAGRY